MCIFTLACDGNLSPDKGLSEISGVITMNGGKSTGPCMTFAYTVTNIRHSRNVLESGMDAKVKVTVPQGHFRKNPPSTKLYYQSGVNQAKPRKYPIAQLWLGPLLGQIALIVAGQLRSDIALIEGYDYLPENSIPGNPTLLSQLYSVQAFATRTYCFREVPEYTLKEHALATYLANLVSN